MDRPARSTSLAPLALLALLIGVAACGPPPRPAVPPPPEPPQLRLHDPAPETITATRDFSAMPTEGQLEEMRSKAEAAIPLVYTCEGCVEAVAAARKERIDAFAKGVKALAGAAKAQGPLLEQMRGEFGTVTGVSVPAPTFNRLRQLPRPKLTQVFAAMIKEGRRADYVIDDRAQLERDKGDSGHVILRVKIMKKKPPKAKPVVKEPSAKKAVRKGKKWRKKGKRGKRGKWVRKAKKAKKGKQDKKADKAAAAAPEAQPAEPPPAPRGDKKKKKKWEERKISPTLLKSVAQVKEALEKQAKVQGAGLSTEMRRLLAAIATRKLVPSVELDKHRTDTRRSAARAAIKRVPLTFIKGVVLLKKGEIVTHPKRRLVKLMYAEYCRPCPESPEVCSGGLLSRLRPGGRIYRDVRAIRDFNVSGAGERTNLRKQEIAKAVPRFYVYDPSVRKTRLAKLTKIFDLALAFEGKDRLNHFREKMDSELDANIMPQLFKDLDKGKMEQVGKAVVGLYDKAQGELLMEAKPQPENEPCTVRRPAPKPKVVVKAKGRGKAQAPKDDIKTTPTCPILPMARLRFELPRRTVNYVGDAVDQLPDKAGKAVVDLVQRLLKPNTTYDAGETLRRRTEAETKAKANKHFFIKGEIVLHENQVMTLEDHLVLKQMFAEKCLPYLFTGRRVED
jgi:7TM-HD extracellular